MEETTADKRQEIKDRIAAAQERQAERANSLMKTIGEKAAVARDEVADFAKQHPVATVAGGLALGVLISALFKNSPTRRAGRYAGERAAGLAAVGSEVAASLLSQVLETTATARKAGAEKLDEAADSTRDAARQIGRAITRSFTRG
ncbi:hypothetical protein [Alteraurantiacibacter buctensis]|uniref:DUF3618 domain-containing protein n=1 Tax=Alteraurantiacibacter buctensis TaxID=1503981 RepID=A0A844YXN4_9SPHN|nr:hypothetical protein [Alteraurantiacibacter buctensis]MXO71720.1 hypothetical protein [Alteraurantiacibacter buctensis]